MSFTLRWARHWSALFILATLTCVASSTLQASEVTGQRRWRLVEGETPAGEAWISSTNLPEVELGLVGCERRQGGLEGEFIILVKEGHKDPRIPRALAAPKRTGLVLSVDFNHGAQKKLRAEISDYFAAYGFNAIFHRSDVTSSSLKLALGDTMIMFGWPEMKSVIQKICR
ncbi:hypothetical protein JKG68_10680 [Microvirga aerilata]|uniref:Uncharacterized protein n=1 Tax=Microvirga aerilata TaxID=670292 RepID=A0A936Z6Q2_9HYPH|nr:hypothetical protein [Microvirga aerilata]MBL0404433.1 hypothetical protein [Microvirga aerilata]